MTDLIKGVDISIIQGVVDYDALAASGVKFCVFRCGVGNGGKDKLYDQNIIKAKAAGLKVMAYHFVYPLPPLASQPLRDPKAQAKLHVDWAGGELAACDLEWPVPQDWGKWNCTAQQIVDWTIIYLEEYERLSGIRPVIYTYPSFADTIHLPDYFGQKYKLWIASYTSVPRIPKPWTDWVLWQNSGGSWKLPNNVPCDTDVAKDLSLWDSVSPEQITDQPVQVPTQEPETTTTITGTDTTTLSIWQTIMKLFSK